MRAHLVLVLVACPLVGCSSDPPKTYGPVFDDDAGNDGAVDGSDAAPPTDAGVDAADVAVDAAVCAQVTAVVAGNASSLAYGVAVGDGGFTGAALAGSAADRIAVLDRGTDFTFVVRAQDGAFFGASSIGTTFAAATAIGPSGLDAPSLAFFGGNAQLLYQGADFKYYRATLTGSTWNSTAEAVGTGVGQSFGPRGPAAAAAGTDLVVMQGGDDTVLYDRTFDGTWQAPHGQTGTAVDKSLPPSIVPMNGGVAELLVVYLRATDFKIMSATRSSGTWAAPTLLDANAFANEPLSLAAIGGGRALLAYRGSDGKGYFSVYDPSQNPLWTLPAPLGVLVESSPAVAHGVCGADGVIAWAKTGGGVEVARLQGTGVGAPTSVSGTAGAKYVGLATR
ncbi:hypothetical protein BH09MYX1_BH09MYX1_34690 [soil metagenome]